MKSTKHVSPVAVILVDHGSRKAEANQMLEDFALLFEKQTTWDIVTFAHMEIAKPSIEEAFALCVAKGAKTVIVFPYFLSPGRHWSLDIPDLTKKAQRLYPEIRAFVSAPLGLHSLLAEVANSRIEHCLGALSGEKESCTICDDQHGCRWLGL